jgi:hypothetical protein
MHIFYAVMVFANLLASALICHWNALICHWTVWYAPAIFPLWTHNLSKWPSSGAAWSG